MKGGIIAAVATVIGMSVMTVSCEKEHVEHYRKAKLTSENTKDGGDDDDDPVIRGKVKKKSNGVAIFNAHVETLTYSTNSKVADVYTDSLGNFDEQVPVGIYYFKITVPGNSVPSYTDTLHVNSSRSVTIEVD